MSVETNLSSHEQAKKNKLIFAKAWPALKGLPSLDRLRVVTLLGKGLPELLETVEFVEFASDPLIQQLMPENQNIDPNDVLLSD